MYVCMNDIYYIKYMNVRMCVGMYVFIYVCMYMEIEPNVCMNGIYYIKYMYVCMYVFIYAYMCMYVYKNSIIRNITSYIHT